MNRVASRTPGNRGQEVDLALFPHFLEESQLASHPVDGDRQAAGNRVALGVVESGLDAGESSFQLIDDLSDRRSSDYHLLQATR